MPSEDNSSIFSHAAPSSSDYPSPHIIPPRQQPHKQTFVILHGRGDHGRAFSSLFLTYPTGEKSELPARFPHVKFVFPTASARPLYRWRGGALQQWFDNVNLNTEELEEVQAEGLRESSAFVHDLLHKEIEILGGDAKNVFLGGMSQGGSTTLVSTLLWDGPVIGGVFGLCTRLPFSERMIRALSASHAHTTPSNEKTGTEAPQNVTRDDRVAALRNLQATLGVENEEVSVSERYLKIPMFLAHGVEDRMTWLQTALKTEKLMRALGTEIEWHQYDDLGHDYSPAMLGDLAHFIEVHTKQNSGV